MNRYLKNAGSVLVTLAAVALAAVLLLHLWRYYMDEPWTRDAHVSADVIRVAPDVSGLVDQVKVRDNERVSRGQVLFVIDQARYQLAVRQARAALDQRRATLAQLRREAVRDRMLSDLVAGEVAEKRRALIQQTRADMAAAQAAMDLAQLNLDRTVVRSPLDGVLNDRIVRLGDYVAAGQAVLSIIDSASIRVDGYFEETKLHGVHVGQQVSVHIMGESAPLYGHVQSIAAGIEDRDRTRTASLLPNVNPAFNWVRLAQRIPVRVVLDRAPANVPLIVGRTATVVIESDDVRRGGSPVASGRRLGQP